jgi:hypothetical protein
MVQSVGPLLKTGRGPKRCAILRDPETKNTLLCGKGIMMAEIAAVVLNFTTIYDFNKISGSIIQLLTYTNVPNPVLLPFSLDGLANLIDVRHDKMLHCSYNLRSRSMSIAVWCFPFDLSTWIVVAVMLCLFWLLQAISRYRIPFSHSSEPLSVVSIKS